jgi:hypothetical protein
MRYLQAQGLAHWLLSDLSSYRALGQGLLLDCFSYCLMEEELEEAAHAVEVVTAQGKLVADHVSLLESSETSVTIAEEMAEIESEQGRRVRNGD